MVTSSRKKWQQAEMKDDDDIQSIAEELGVSKLFVKICLSRGLTNIDEMTQFIHVDESWIHDPFLMHGMDKAVERISQAIERQEHMTIYGDYDADGMTSTAVLYETLEMLGANVDYYLPSRFVEGYGPNIEAFKKIIQKGTSLIITVDNGVAGHDAISVAKELDVDVIVTDHHELPENLPDAYAIIHPKHPEGNYPFQELAGVGVSFKLAHALLGEFPVEALDLVAIGTVADLVPLKGENRALVYFGLKVLEQTQRVGLLELLNVIGKTPNEVNEETIGFQLAPRLNAVGRLGEAGQCVELLYTYEPDRARELAEYVNKQNEERKRIVEEMTLDVKEKLKNDTEPSNVIVLADEKWHQGVLGIVASRIVENTNKPTLLFTTNQETGLAKGSARSIEGFNLYNAFQEIDDLFIQFGGHAMAAGMSAEESKLKEIKTNLSEQIKNIGSIEATRRIDATIPLNEITIDSVNEINQLRPFGTGNEKPLIVSENVSVLQSRSIGTDGNHLKLLVGQNEEQLDIISFQKGHIHELLFDQQEVSVAGHLEINEWNGNRKVQLQMIDIDIPGPVMTDQRTNQLLSKHFKKEHTDFVFYDANTYQKNVTHIKESSRAIMISSISEAKEYVSSGKIVIVDCPPSIEIFKKTLTSNETAVISCYFYKDNHLYLSGLPNREDFTKAYKFFAANKNIDLKKHGNLLSAQLKLDSNKIFLIVKVFLEASFVIINSGVLNVVEHPEKQNILKTKSYQKAQEKMKAEELFIYSSFKEIISASI